MGAVQIESTQIRWFLGQSGGEAGLPGGRTTVRRWPKILKTNLAQGGPSGSKLLRSDGSWDGQAGA
jgi:hypothetical protein